MRLKTQEKNGLTMMKWCRVFCIADLTKLGLRCIWFFDQLKISTFVLEVVVSCCFELVSFFLNKLCWQMVRNHMVIFIRCDLSLRPHGCPPVLLTTMPHSWVRVFSFFWWRRDDFLIENKGFCCWDVWSKVLSSKWHLFWTFKKLIDFYLS